ncbi:MAG: hypothetical protein K2H72_03575, partial [Muribaculaceae bacterium]|nr:hypothetical protein [Muribaculaceae bacterium]
VYLAAMVCARHSESRLLAAGIAVPAVIIGLTGLIEPFVTDTEWFAAFGLDLDGQPAIRYAWYVMIAGSFMTLWYLYRRKDIHWAVETLSLTVLALVFVGGLSIRSFNADMGYKAISREADALSRDYPSAEIKTWKIDRPENIDVYLKDTPFTIVEPSDTSSLMPLPSYPAIVMTKEKFRREIPDIKASRKVGVNYVVVYCDTTENDKP